ncbi:MAG: sulfur transferase domain-containing protein, partial [Bdellovibrionota bacterium]
NEAEASRQLGLKLVDIPFSSGDMQYADDWKKYLETLETAERPILVHCRSGADRTSEASAVYAMEYMGYSKEKAIDEQMTYWHLHVPYFQPAKTQFIRNYQGAEWLKTEYHPCSEEMRAFAANRCTPEILEGWLAAKAGSAVSSSP